LRTRKRFENRQRGLIRAVFVGVTSVVNFRDFRRQGVLVCGLRGGADVLHFGKITRFAVLPAHHVAVLQRDVARAIGEDVVHAIFPAGQWAFVKFAEVACPRCVIANTCAAIG
jgi:hypothetical protein